MVAHFPGPYDEPEPSVAPLDVVMLSDVEVRAVLVMLATDSRPEIRDALSIAVRRTLERTRT